MSSCILHYGRLSRPQTYSHKSLLFAFAGPSRMRNYATSKKSQSRTPARQSSKSGFRGNRRNETDGPIAVRKEKRPGAFQALPANQLKDTVFQGYSDTLSHLKMFYPESLTALSISTALRFPDNDKDPMRIFGLPRNILIDFRIMSQPLSIIRGVTIDVLNKVEAGGHIPGGDTRFVLTGEAGCGKSFLLLQTVQYCFAKDWIVLYIPRGVNLVNSTTDYIYDLRTQTYLQPGFARQTLQRFFTVNIAKLQSMYTQSDIELEQRPVLRKGISLVELINIGLQEQALAPSVLSSLLGELGQQTKHPLLIAVDDFQAFFCKSLYKDPHFSRIRPYHLSMPRLLLDYASNKRPLARGAFIGALCASDPFFHIPLELQEALDLPYDRLVGPYTKRYPNFVEYARGIEALQVPSQLSTDEAATMFEVWKNDNALQSYPNDEIFLAKYSETGGNAREFVRRGLLASLAP